MCPPPLLYHSLCRARREGERESGRAGERERDRGGGRERGRGGERRGGVHLREEDAHSRVRHLRVHCDAIPSSGDNSPLALGGGPNRALKMDILKVDFEVIFGLLKL